MTLRSALSTVGAFWIVACSFPAYEFVPETEVEPIPDDPYVRICTDGRSSEAETGIDCGGGCPPCGMGEPCDEHDDCESRTCRNGTCQIPACDDGVTNGSESDEDCGGQCEPCPPPRDCRTDEDCAERVCADDICQFPTCSDMVHNGNETGLDCGGDTCGPCPLGEPCLEDGDCSSNHCDVVCVSPGCTDGSRNELETDIDCGGPECGPCQPGQQCEFDQECTSRICDADRCTTPSCHDEVLNGDESSPDCGGTSCEGCPNLASCDDGGDCAGGACQSGLCVPAAATGAPLSRIGWVATASNSYADDDPNEVLDDEGNRWTSGTAQYDGMWLEVDMGELKTFFSVVLVCEEQPEDFPTKFDVYFSTDGTRGDATEAGLFGATTSIVSFDTAQIARYVRVVLREAKGKWWSIDEFRVHE